MCGRVVFVLSLGIKNFAKRGRQMIKNIFTFYRDGFRNMRLGKTLWLVIAVKIIVIFAFLKVFIYGESLHDLGSTEAKSAFVLQNLTQDNKNK